MAKRKLMQAGDENGSFMFPWICVTSNRVKKIIFLHELVYIKGSGKSCLFYIQKDKEKEPVPVAGGKNLGAYAGLLKPKGYWRVHQSYMVNPIFVDEVTPEHVVILRCEVKDMIHFSRGQWSKMKKLIEGR